MILTVLKNDLHYHLDINVDYVHRLLDNRALTVKKLNGLVVNPLFTGENDIVSEEQYILFIKDNLLKRKFYSILFLSFLESLGTLLDSPVPVQHVQQSIFSVKSFVLAAEVLSNQVIRHSKIVDIWPVRCCSRQLDLNKTPEV